MSRAAEMAEEILEMAKRLDRCLALLGEMNATLQLNLDRTPDTPLSALRPYADRWAELWRELREVDDDRLREDLGGT